MTNIKIALKISFCIVATLILICRPAFAQTGPFPPIWFYDVNFFKIGASTLNADVFARGVFCNASTAPVVGLVATMSRMETTIGPRSGSAPYEINIPMSIFLLPGGAKEPRNQTFVEVAYDFFCGAAVDVKHRIFRWPGKSMSIVMDDTGSMGNELEGLKIAVAGTLSAPSILNSSRGNDAYELISFKDSVTTRVPITTDLVAVINGVESLQASGGGECPEASSEALMTALNHLDADTDRAGRILFVTDASPSTDLRASINSKALSLHVPIDVLLTGDCASTTALRSSQNTNARSNVKAVASVISAKEYFQSIATATGGKFKYMPDATVDEYSEFLENALNEDRYGYTSLVPGTRVVNGDAGQTTYFRIDAPAKTKTLELIVSGGTGNVSFLVKEGELPTRNDFWLSSESSAGSTVARLPVMSDKEKSYYIKLTGDTKYTNKSISVRLINP